MWLRKIILVLISPQIVVEIAGYVCRFLAHGNASNLVLFVIQTLAILVAPALFAASIYMVLGRLIVLLHAEAQSPIRPGWLTKIFVGGDVLSFLIQVIGSSNLSKNFSLAKTIILLGLAIQIMFFGVFVVVAFVVDRRLSRAPTHTAQRLDAQNTRLGWRGVLRVIYIASAMIFVRSIFRLVEFCGDSDSPMMKTEAYLYVCDSTLMFGVLAILIYYHPGNYIPSRKDFDEILELQDEEML